MPSVVKNKMVERYKRSKGKRKLLGNHQKCWVWGRNTILETLKAGVWEIRDLWLSSELPGEQLEQARQMANELDVPTEVVDRQALHSKCHSHEHQGFVARMTEFPYGDTNELASIIAQTPIPLIAVCDGLQDPFNFGAIIRSAEVLGVQAIVIGNKNQVGVTSLVARASAGAVNHVPIIRLDDVAEELAKHKDSLSVIGASEKAEQELREADLFGPTAIVIGNEGTGISPTMLKTCDSLVSIPQIGQVDSLNAAVSASVFFYEAVRQLPASSRNPPPSANKAFADLESRMANLQCELDSRDVYGNTTTTHRREIPTDSDAIRAVTISAFAASEFGHNGEADLIEQIRASDPNSMSLVAIHENELVGHVLFSRAVIRTVESELAGMALGPMSVEPNSQRCGHGTGLVELGLESFDRTACPFVIVLGHPDYYPKFGFRPAAEYGITHGFAGIPQNVFFIRWNKDTALPALNGGQAWFAKEFGPQHAD